MLWTPILGSVGYSGFFVNEGSFSENWTAGNYLHVFDLFTLRIFHLFWFVTCISMISHITEQFVLLGKLPYPFPWERSSGLTTPQRWQIHFLLLWAWLHWFKECARIQLRNSVCSYESSVCIYSKVQTVFGLPSYLPAPSALKVKW